MAFTEYLLYIKSQTKYFINAILYSNHYIRFCIFYVLCHMSYYILYLTVTCNASSMLQPYQGKNYISQDHPSYLVPGQNWPKEELVRDLGTEESIVNLFFGGPLGLKARLPSRFDLTVLCSTLYLFSSCWPCRPVAAPGPPLVLGQNAQVVATQKKDLRWILLSFSLKVPWWLDMLGTFQFLPANSDQSRGTRISGRQVDDCNCLPPTLPPTLPASPTIGEIQFL